MTYKKKKGDSEDEAVRKFIKSKYFKKIRTQSTAIENNPTFQKELQDLKKNFPRPKTDKEYRAYVDKTFKKARAKGLKETVYFQEWHNLCDNWGIEFMSLCMGKVTVKGTVTTGTRGKNDIPYIEIISKDATAQDVIDNLPFSLATKEFHLGKARATQGRKSKEVIFKKIRAEYKKRIKKEKSNVILNDLTKKYVLKPARIYRIIYTKKYDKAPS